MFKSCYVKIKNDSGEVFFPYSFKTEDAVIKEKKICKLLMITTLLIAKNPILIAPGFNLQLNRIFKNNK